MQLKSLKIVFIIIEITKKTILRLINGNKIFAKYIGYEGLNSLKEPVSHNKLGKSYIIPLCIYFMKLISLMDGLSLILHMTASWPRPGISKNNTR